MGPVRAWEKEQNTSKAAKSTVEHLSDDRDIFMLTEKRKINGVGIVEPPPESISSFSTVRRRVPTFSVNRRTHNFQFMDERLAFEDLDDGSESIPKKNDKKFTKKNRSKIKLGTGEVHRVIESTGESEFPSNLSNIVSTAFKILKEGTGFRQH